MDDRLNKRLTRRLNLNSEIIEDVYSTLSQIDAVKQSWSITGKLLPQTINRLTTSVIVTSTGSSNRIEGNQLSDDEIDSLYRNLRIKKFKTRDEQEVAGYLSVLSVIFDCHDEMSISESIILQLHRDMLAYSHSDERHRGSYKFGSNRVAAKDTSGNIVGIIFEPTPPHLVSKEMQELLEWYQIASSINYKHPLILIANFIFEYLAIHPFQDGNGRTSRLLTNLMLLKAGYKFTSIVSHEKHIEANKVDYYHALNKVQSSWKTESEDMSQWFLFFFKIILEQSKEALRILKGDNIDYLLSENQSAILNWARTLSTKTFARKDAIESLKIPPRTVEAAIKKLLDLKQVERLGAGRATRYRLIG